MGRKTQIAKTDDSKHGSFNQGLDFTGVQHHAFWLVGSGKIIIYINPRFAGVTKVTAVVMFLMFLAQAGQSWRRAPLAHESHYFRRLQLKWKYILFVIPFLMAYLLPTTAMDANSAASKGISLGTDSATTVQKGDISASAPEYSPQSMDFLPARIRLKPAKPENRP